MSGRLPTSHLAAAWVEWRPIAGDPTVPLFPDGLQDLIDDWLRPR